MLISMRRFYALLLLLVSLSGWAQINTDRVLLMGRNALYYEDYVLSIQRFNMVISAKPHLAEAYFYRALAKFYLEDFPGATADLNSAIERNPYAENYYVLRGLCLINMKEHARAERDYTKAISINPNESSYWHNRVLCLMQDSIYERADSCLDVMLRRWPKDTEHYTMKAQVQIALKDTANAERWVDRALEINEYDAGALGMKSSLLLYRHAFDEAEVMLDRAIAQSPRQANLFLDRGLLRYNKDNLRGAMDDYNIALEINPKSFVGHYNRGLLRAQVGDNNSAIEDFNFVIEREPDNYMAIYNRALLENMTGDYKAAIRDLSTIINEFPQFWDGYLLRAEIRRKLGDKFGAERDEFKVMKARVEGFKKQPKKDRKTRRKDDEDLDAYDQLVENDLDEPQREYKSEYRGKVQDRSTHFIPLGLYQLSYYQPKQTVSNYQPFMQMMDDLNRSRQMGVTLYLTNSETVGSNATVNGLMEDIQYLSQRLQSGRGNYVNTHLRRAFDYYHVRDFESAVCDADSVLEKNGDHQLALMLRSQVRVSAMVVKHPALTMEGKTAADVDIEVKVEMRRAIDDLTRLSKLDKANPMPHYNIGCIYLLMHDEKSAIEAFDAAVKADPNFPDAYFNRGIAYMRMGKREEALSDLSQAGEYGLYSAYNLIKQLSKMK